MSDGKEVKRWETISIDTKIPGTRPDVDGVPRVTVVSASDHDRIVAELKTDVARLCETVRYLESTNPQLTDAEKTIAKLRAEVAQAKREAADAMSGCCDCPMFKAKGKTIARQARVIEKLKGMVPHYETCATVDRYDDEIVPCDCGLDKELAAIEREGKGT